MFDAEAMEAELDSIDGAAICAARDRFLQRLAESYFEDQETSQEKEWMEMDEHEDEP